MKNAMKLRFRPAATGTDQVLGELESDIMNLVWKNPGSTAREIHAGLSDRDLAHTTILTVLDRLHRKGLVSRERVGRAFSFSPAIDKQEFDAQVTRDVLRGLLKESSRPILNTFVDLVAVDEALLDELEQLVRDKKI